MISLEQIDNFITTKLDLPDWKSLFEIDRLEFLRVIVRRHMFKIYFQNISMAAQDTAKRSRPSEEDIIKNGLEGNGGVCIQLNYFIHLLLQALGFDTFLAAAQVSQSVLIKSHVVVIVQMDSTATRTNTKPKKLTYLVDIACGLPNFEVIPLDELPWRGMAAGYPYEYRYSDGVYQRLQLGGRFYKGDFENGTTEELRYSFELQPKPFTFFDRAMNVVFTDEATSFFLKNTFMFRHFETPESKSKFVMIWGTSVVEGDYFNRVVTKFDSYEKMIPVIKNHFPNLCDDELEKSIQYFKEYTVKPSKYAA